MNKPPILYKYRPFNTNTISCLLNKEIFFSDPDRFNDPFDSEYSLNLPSNILNRAMDYANKLVLNEMEKRSPKEATWIRVALLDIIRQNDEDYLKYYLVKILANLRLFNKINIGIYSMSSINNNILMWSHYARNHTGICIGFDSNIHPFSNAQNVSYTNQYYQFNSKTFKNKKYVLEPFLRKSSHWRYEKEYRIISEEGGGLIQFNPKAIKRIYFGCRSSNHTIKMVQLLVSKYPQKIYLYKLEKSLSKYTLIASKV